MSPPLGSKGGSGGAREWPSKSNNHPLARRSSVTLTSSAAAPVPHPLPVPIAPSLYNPSIYSYTCRGIWSASSKNPYSKGTCRGLTGRLELLTDLRPSSREKALQTFVASVADPFTEMDDELEHASATPAAAALNNIQISPALIYKGTPPPPVVQSQSETQTQQSPEMFPPAMQTPKTRTRKVTDATVVDILKAPEDTTWLNVQYEEEIIRQQHWNCYGITDVDMLILVDRNTGNKHIAAVAPHNAGVSMRSITTDDRQMNKIDIWHLSVETLSDLVEMDTEMNRESNPEINPETNSKSVVAWNAAHRYMEYSAKFGEKFGEKLKQNVQFLSETLQDQFALRAWKAGEKIVKKIPDTIAIVRTGVERLISASFGEESGDNEKRGGRDGQK